MDISPLVALVPVILAVALIITLVRRNITERRPGQPLDLTGAIPAVVVLMVAVILIGGMASSIEERDYELYDCVPLSAFGSEAVLEGDCIETVTIGGTEYVRMTDLGTFTVTSGDSSKEYTVTKAKMDLVVWAGQSNSMRFTNPSYYEGEATILPGQGFYLGSEEPATDEHSGIVRQSTVDSAVICDMIDDEGEMRVAQMYPTFYGDYIAETGHRLITVSTGIPGVSITYWDDDQPADVLMKTALERLKEQCEGKIDLNPVGILWIQGENDYNQTEEFYLEHFEPLLEKMEDGYYGFKFPHITSSLTKVPTGSMNPPALAQIAVAEEDSKFTIASSLAYRWLSSTATRDGVHLTQQTYEWIGEAFARELAIVTGYTPVKETLVLTERFNGVSEIPASIEVYGTSGEAFDFTPTWTQTGTGVYSWAVTGAPSGTRILDGLTATAVLSYVWENASNTLTVNKNVSGSSPAWASYAAQVDTLVISSYVSSVAGTAFSGCTGLIDVTIPSSIESIDSSCFGTAFEDVYGNVLTSITPGRYVGTGDGTVYEYDPSIFTFSDDNETLTGLTSDASAAVNIVLPAEKDGTTISGIGSSAFNGNTTIERALILPEEYGLTLFGTNAFRGATSLVSLVLPDSVTTMNTYSLYGCTSLASFDMPDSVTTIGTHLMERCTGLTVLALSDDLTSIPKHAFNGCTGLTQVSIPDNVTIVDEAAFYNCSSLAAVTYGSSVTTIGNYAFQNCDLTGFVFKASLTSIGNQSFQGNTSVTSVSFDQGFAATLGNGCFYSWTFYDTDGTTVIDKTAASNLAGHTFAGTASALVMQS